ncbi:MAG: helix-turn-helix domain-containing protein [Microbacteriaceae bacterium]|nr:helix-turn-helix domain-containing protein [Microbacteriaceae bacterium]
MDDAFWAALEDPLPVRELAPLLRVHEATVLRRLQDGTIPGHFIGRSWIVFKCEIRAWLLTRRNTPTGEAVETDPLAGWPDELRMGELVQFFGKTKQTIRRWLEHGDIPGYRINGRWITYASELRESLAASSNQRPS